MPFFGNKAQKDKSHEIETLITEYEQLKATFDASNKEKDMREVIFEKMQNKITAKSCTICDSVPNKN